MGPSRCCAKGPPRCTNGPSLACVRTKGPSLVLHQRSVPGACLWVRPGASEHKVLAPSSVG
eukprot:7683457-Alexandrium_andersonii.AAC.1